MHFQAYGEAIEHFLSGLNFQAAVQGPTERTKPDLSKVMSDNIWSSLRLALGLMGKRDLYPFIETRNLEKLNDSFGITTKK